LTSQSYSSVG